MPDYGTTNALAAQRDLPWFYWSGETEMNCLAQAMPDRVAQITAEATAFLDSLAD